MAIYCGENVSIALGYSPLGIMDITKTEDFRPNIAFAYNADVEPENISVTEHHTFTVSSTAEVEEEKGFYSTVYAAASKKVKTLAGYIKSASRFCGFYSSSMVS